MILEYLKYTRQEGCTNEWSIEGKDGNPVKFENINLIVGRNSAGKSRFLNIIRRIAALLSLNENISDIRYSHAKYHLILKENDDRYGYYLEINNNIVVQETLSVNGVEKYNRINKTIFSESTRKYNDLQIADNSVITELKDNEKDYPYIAEIFEWSNALKKYVFTNQHEKNHFLSNEYQVKNTVIDTIDSTENVIHLFAEGKKLFKETFQNQIIKDLKQIGYDVSSIYLLESDLGKGIAVQEQELSEPTIQTDMSQGMFRALAFIIQLNFALLKEDSVCMLIDDLGEGLDYHRSKSLIDMLIYKVTGSNIQIFITTNDRYIMNKIPLKYWNIICRKPKVSVLYNYYNSQTTFDDFKFTGLSNFDFLATDFYKDGFEGHPEA